ncbi:LytTR family transcriptional regulator DNA-binding domain-containing protein [Viscerimonas tarda]
MNDKTTTEIRLTQGGESITLELDLPLAVIREHINRLGVCRETKSRYKNLASYYLSYSRKTIPVNEIMYLKSDRSYCLFYFCDGSSLMKSKSMSYFLKNHYADSLVRIHKTYAVNMNYLKRPTSRYVILHEDIRLPRGRKLSIDNKNKWEIDG